MGKLKTTASLSRSGLELRNRLREIVATRSQSDVARLTNTSVANVNRYLNGRRFPAEFAVSLVVGMKVNPVWLLTGTGAMFLSEVPQSAAKAGGEMLALVEAMNAVSHVQLAAVGGKHHTKILSGLNNALLRYESLRKQLNEHSTKLLAGLLEDWQQKLSKFDLDQSGQIRRTAEQVARMCDDPALQRRLLKLQASDEFFNNRYDKALACEKQLLMLPLAEGRIVEAENLRTFLRVILGYHTRLHFRQALQVCEAALALCGPDGARWDAYAITAFQKGRMQAELGDLLGGLAIMQQWIGRAQNERDTQAMRLWITPFLLFAGMLRIDDATEFGEHLPPKVQLIAPTVAWREDVAGLEHLARYARDKRIKRMGDIEVGAQYGPMLLSAVKTKSPKALDDYDAAAFRMDAPFNVAPAVFRTQLLRVMGERERALEELQKAERDIAALEPDVTYPVAGYAAHYRNALLLIAENEKRPALKGLRAKAESWFAETIARGYTSFRDFDK